MPVRKVRPSAISEDVRHRVKRFAEAMFSDRPHSSIHSVMASDDDDAMAPTETNALRVVIDGWAASLHRTAIPVLVHLDGDGSRNMEDAVENQLRTALLSQVKRETTAHHAGLPAPVQNDPFSWDDAPIDVEHLDGQQLEIDHMLASGGPAMVREVYGRLARTILVRRRNGVSAAYDGGTMVGTEISARIRIGDHAELKNDTMVLRHHVPETVAEAMRGRPLGRLVEVPGITDAIVETITRHDGNRLSRGLKQHDHSRVVIRYVHRQGLRWRLARHEKEKP